MNVETMTKGRALIVHDDMEMRHSLALSMHHAGYDVDFAETADEALSKARQTRPAVVITDLHMTGMDDMTALHEIRRAAPEMSIVVLTASGAIAPAVDALRTVADDYVIKPVNPDALHLAVERAVDRKKQRAETDLMRRTLAELRDAHAALQAERGVHRAAIGGGRRRVRGYAGRDPRIWRGRLGAAGAGASDREECGVDAGVCATS